MYEGLLSQSNTVELAKRPIIAAQRAPSEQLLDAIAPEMLTEIDLVAGTNAALKNRLLQRIMPDSSMAPALGESVDIERGGQ